MIQPAGSTACSNTTTNPQCYTLNEYVQVFKALSVPQPTTVVFLTGKHYLNETWLIQRLNVHLSLQGQTSAQVYLDVLHPLTIEDSNSIEISSLDFVLNLSSSLPIVNTTVFVVFTNSSVQLANLSFFQVGEKLGTLNAVQSCSSTVNISDTTFVGNFRALSASSLSLISFTGRNIFEGNVAEQGGAIYSLNSQIILLGMNTFENNAAVLSDDSYGPANGGAIICYDSRLKINGSTEFVSNTAESGGGAMALYNSILDVEGSVTFWKNSARCNGGACFIQSSIVSIRAYTSFDGNSVTAPGTIITTQFNLDQISTNGGAIYSDDSNINITGTSFTNQVSSGSGGAVFVSSGAITLNDIVMINNSATTFYAGGLRGIVGREGGGFMTISGTNVFANNSGYDCGGALEIVSFESVLINGTNNFTNNYAIQGRGSALCFAGTKTVTILGETYIEGNVGCAVTADFRNNGTGIDSDRRTGTNMLFLGQTYFINNSYTDGGALCSRFSSITVLNTMVFDSNSATNGAAIASYDSVLVFTGDQYFVRNSAARSGGAIYSENSSWVFTGDQIFDGNSAYQGGAIFATFRNYFTMYGHQHFVNNSAVEGGAIYSFANYVLKLEGEQVFQTNTVFQGGGAISTYDSIWTMSGNQQFIGNEGVYGGAMALQGSTSLILSPSSTTNFTENQARTFGGAIYFEDSISSIQCSQISGVPKDCFLKLNDSTSNVSEISLVFVRNQAGTSGSVMFGGELNYCSFYKGYTDEAGSNDGQINYYNSVDPIQVIRNLSTIISYNEEDALSDITSLPVQVCKCDNNSINCGVSVVYSLTLMPGQTFNFRLGVVGQDTNRTVVPAFVLSTETANSSLYPPMQSIQNLCAEVSYRLLSNVTNTVNLFEIYPDGPCQALRGALQLSIQVMSCPPGFVLSNSECHCEERLRQLNKTCYVDSLSVEREQNDIWMKPLYNENGSYDGLLIHRGGCPFDFCINRPINVTLTDYNVQCAYNRSGTLCGSCKENFSLAFGTLHCLPTSRCSNAYIALILVFIVAGILLVTCLFLLNLTVAIGTINGLIFYANIVQANRHVFFSQGEFRPLEVFVAWLNLDFGIEICFYNGMNTYVYAWLQFAFPFYVWFLMGFIIVVSRYSQTVTKYLGKNPVAVLATLLLLSYAKILNSIIIALSQTSVSGPDRLEKVWLYNGEVPYFQGVHIVLALFAIFTLILLFLPYTLLLFSGHWFQTFSNWKVLSWLNKLKPLLDAYYAPFRKKGRYWVGLLLFTRLALIMTFAFNAMGSDGINLLAISSVTTALSVMKGRVYDKRANGILESSFVLNLCLFSIVTFYLKAGDASEYQVYLSNVSVGIALLTFIGIIIFHIFLRIRTTSLWKRTIKPMFVQQKDGNVATVDSHNVQSLPTSSTVAISIELREPLLESAEVNSS